jgi:hypothetical protein
LKKAISLILCFIMLLASVSYAVGDPNMDGDGGGNLGGGTGKNYWVSGDDGVARIFTTRPAPPALAN